MNLDVKKVIKKIDIKRVIFILFFISLLGYVLWDVSLRVRNYYLLQGYQTAVSEVFNQASNENCSAFNVFSEDKEIVLVNVDCLQQSLPEEE